MWSAEGGGSVHSKTRLVSLRQHRATEVQKLRFLSSCQYTHGCYAPASWAARHTTVCLDTDVSDPPGGGIWGQFCLSVIMLNFAHMGTCEIIRIFMFSGQLIRTEHTVLKIFQEFSCNLRY